MKNSTTRKTGERWMARSRQHSPSTKRPKPPGRVFGTSSQFAGVGAGRPGDPRR
jgi:hypothetical protein